MTSEMDEMRLKPNLVNSDGQGLLESTLAQFVSAIRDMPTEEQFSEM